MFIWVYFIAAAINYVHWAVLVINKFCAHLNINCLTIKHPRRGYEGDLLDDQEELGESHGFLSKGLEVVYDAGVEVGGSQVAVVASSSGAAAPATLARSRSPDRRDKGEHLD
ncbi:hypothetical protein BCR44DRAFT_59042 [Catenaria anguillulae PL171]|uniref:Uncharacterized protein n=1 Tax=Catenaria anguillulae PL171 TaxID=765915 RepID=A0A1Y2HSB5_9FUNG|nr:hypothetical protein BCR44DRAFT_59042 [Catenaria anguillulae PL171]